MKGTFHNMTVRKDVCSGASSLEKRGLS